MEINNKVEGINSGINNLTDKLSDTAKNTYDNTTQIASQATDAAKEAISPYMNSSGAIYGLIFVIIIASITSYALFVLVSGVIFQQTRDVIEGTKIPVLCNVKTVIPITTFNKSGNGQRRSYSFWIYINDMTKYSGSYKHVFHIGDDNTIKNASPLVFLDKEVNSMYIRISKKDDTDDTDNLSSINPLDYIRNQGIKIDHVPTQRWVHIAIVINESAVGSSIIAYVDGEVANTTSSDYSNTELNVTNFNLDKRGDLITGGNSFETDNVGFSGLISKVVIYNYDLNQKDIYKEYNDGPIDGILAKLGLGTYGIRSPVYKIV